MGLRSPLWHSALAIPWSNLSLATKSCPEHVLLCCWDVFSHEAAEKQTTPLCMGRREHTGGVQAVQSASLPTDKNLLFFCPCHSLFLPCWDHCRCLLPHGSLLLPFQPPFLLIVPTPPPNSYCFLAFSVAPHAFYKVAVVLECSVSAKRGLAFNHHRVITLPT